MKALLIAGAAGLMTYALPTLAQMAGGPAAEWGRAVTRTQAEQEARARFALADANKDGFLTRDEIHAAAEARMAEGRGKAFDRIDTDHNGTITREEFSTRRDGPDGPRIIERRVERMSPDGAKGGQDRLAMRVMMMRHGGPGGGAMIMMADTDKDGRISQAEATDGAMRLFDRTDVNHDGTVTPEERAGAMRAWGDRIRAWGDKVRDGAMHDMPPPPPPAG